jgi:hypothetical protein
MQESENKNIGAVNHPAEAEWMAYLYNEIAPERKRELHAHLKQCNQCSKHMAGWRAGMSALDDWKLPAVRPAIRSWQPTIALKWAAAAVVMLSVGFTVGRQNSHASREVAELKNSIQQLASTVQSVRETAANQELAQSFADYARLNDESRAEDRQKLALALRDIDLRLLRLRGEIETVAVNTESGFEQTRDGLTQLATIATADRNPTNGEK